MPNHELAMLTYVKLADLSQQKQQMLGRDKFLILAAAAACRSGWLEVADRCRGIVLTNNQRHLVGKSLSFADALRDEEFQVFLKQLERFCSYEKAEHLLRELEIEPARPESESINCGAYAVEILSRPHWADP